MNLNEAGLVYAQGGGYPPGGYGPPGGGPPGGGGYPPGGAPPGGAPPGGGPPGWGPPGGNPPGGGGYGPPGGPPGGGGYGPPGGPPGGGGYGPPGGPPGGGGYGPPGGPPGGGGYGPPGGGYGPPGAPPGGGGYGPPGGGPPGWGPPGGQPPGPSQFGGFVPPTYNGPQQMGAGAPGFDPMAAIGFGWNAVMKDFAAIALPIVVAMLVVVVPTVILSVISGVVMGALGTRLDPVVLRLFTVVVQCVTQVITLGTQAFMFGGLVQFTLGVCRGQKPAFNVVFGGGRFFLPMLGGQLLYTLGVAVGFMLCLVPGFILACGWLCYQPFIVDRGLGPVDALKASWRITTGQRGGIFLYLLLSGVVGLLGVLALCVGALLVAWPVLAVANAYVYLKLTGEEPRALA